MILSSEQNQGTKVAFLSIFPGTQFLRLCTGAEPLGNAAVKTGAEQRREAALEDCEGQQALHNGESMGRGIGRLEGLDGISINGGSFHDAIFLFQKSSLI